MLLCIPVGDHREAVVDSLAERRSRRAIPYLIDRFRRDTAPSASRELTAYGDAAVDALSEALISGDPATRYWAAGTLGEIGAAARSSSAGVERAIRADAFHLVRHRALAALARIDPERARAVLRECVLRQDLDLLSRTLSLQLLEELGPASLPPVAELQIIAQTTPADSVVHETAIDLIRTRSRL